MPSNTRKDIDVNSSITIVAAIFMAVIGPEIFIVVPGFVQGMVEYVGFSEQQAGYIASYELFATAFTTVLMTFLSHRINWQHTFYLALGLAVLGNLLTLLADSYNVFIYCRLIAGLGAGLLISLGFAVVGLTRNSERNFGYLVMWVLVYGAVVLMLMPYTYKTVGMNGLLCFFAIFAALGLPFVKYLPVNGDSIVHIESDAIELSVLLKGSALMAMLIYFLGQGVVWTYLFLIGTAGGLSEQAVANSLTLSQFSGIAGAFVAVVLANRLGRILPLTISIIVGASSLLLIMGEFDFLLYTTSVVIFNGLWNLTHPYLLASMASFDRKGKVVVYAAAMQMIGVSIGPFVAANLIDDGSYTLVLWTGLVLILTSWFLILPPLLKQRRKAAEATLKRTLSETEATRKE